MNLIELAQAVSAALEEHYQLLGEWPEPENASASAQPDEQEPETGLEDLENELWFLSRRLGHQTARLAGLRPYISETGKEELERALDAVWEVSAQLMLLDLKRYFPPQGNGEDEE